MNTLPQRAKSTQLRHTYEVENITIKYWDGNGWKDYHIYDALTSLNDLPFINAGDLANKKHGYWQMVEPETYNKLRLLAQTPISYMTETANPTPLEDFGITYQTLFCEDETIAMLCQRWDNLAVGTSIPAKQVYLDRKLTLRIDKPSIITANANPYEINSSLEVKDGGKIEVFFKEATAVVGIKLTTEANNVTINLYERIQRANGTDEAPTMDWRLTHQRTVNGDFGGTIYDIADKPVDKLEIIIPDNIPEEGSDFTSESTYLHEVCWQTVSNYLYNQTLIDESAIQAETDELLEGLNKVIQPIWRPNTKYVVQVEVKDKLSGAAQLDYTTYHNYGFSTKGTIGHFHKHDSNYNNLKDIEKDQYFFADLRSYVDYSKSYPNADGNLLNAKPLFFEHPKLSLFFVKPYVYTMFNDFGSYNGLPNIPSQLSAVIRDPADQPNSTSKGTQTAQAKWLQAEEGLIEKDVQMINNLIVNGRPCVETTITRPPNMFADLVPEALLPRKTYTAIINSEFDKDANEVLRYVFETSRYPDFKSQVESYILSEDGSRKAIYNLDLKDVDTSITQQVFDDSLPDKNNLRRDFAHQFDRLLFTLGIKAMEVATTTEFNIVRDEDKVLGVLVRSPEPFNDPKIEADIITSELLVRHPDIGFKDFRTLISKDGASMFISTDSLFIERGTLSITIPYMEFDGYKYIKSVNLAHQAETIDIQL